MKVLFLTPPMLDYTVAYGSNVSSYIEYPAYAAVLETYLPSVEVEILECPAHRITQEQLDDELKRRSPDVIVMGVFYAPQVVEATEGLEQIKALNPEIITVGEGLIFGNMPQESLERQPNLDVVLVGEGELTLLELVEAIAQNDADYSAIKGLAWRDGERIVVNERRPLINNLDDLPRPAYHLMDLDKNLYSQFGIDHYLRIYTSRGCKARCEFCYRWPFYRGTYRTRSGRSMAEEIAHLNQTYGVRTFEIYEADFGEDVLMVENFCQALIEKDLDIQMWCMTRADNIVAWNQRDLLPKLRQAGLKLAIVGIEYYTDERLEAMGKAISTEDLRSAFRLLREHDIISTGAAIIGWEDETEETAEALYSFMVDDLKTDLAAFTCLHPQPGSPMWHKMKDDPSIITDYRYQDHFHPTMPTRELSMQQVGQLMMRMWGRFYSDPTHTQPILESGNQIAVAMIKQFVNTFARPGQKEAASPRISDT